MGARHDYTAWSARELKRLSVLSAQGLSAPEVTATLNAEFHHGVPVRTVSAVQLKRGKHGIKVGERPKRISDLAQREQAVEQTAGPDGIEARANGTRIKTVDDLLRHIEADLTRFEVERSEATKYEVATKDPNTGDVLTTELHRVFVKLRPKAGPSAVEIVTAIVNGAMASRARVRAPACAHAPARARTHARARADVMQCVVIADPHVGKYAWAHETGWEDYDIGIATTLLRESAAELLADGMARHIGRRTLVLLGDYFHYDTPHGQTTKGTPLDRDGRVEKMMANGARALFDIIEESATQIPTHVVLVPGNHDAILTIALRQLVAAQFRNDARVTVDTDGTTRKYLTHGKCLIGFTHGDKARKRLGELMALEARTQWGESTYREIHTGHLHSIAEVQTISGVTVRTHPALCPPDGWHALEGFVGATRGMQAFYYHAAGGLVGMTMSNPDMTRRDDAK